MDKDQEKWRRVQEEQSVFDVFLKALTEYYVADGVAPGVVVSWLPDRRVFYCSVRRYSLHTFALRSSVVVTGVSKLSADQAVIRAMHKWKDEVKQPRQSNLKLLMTLPFDGSEDERW